MYLRSDWFYQNSSMSQAKVTRHPLPLPLIHLAHEATCRSSLKNDYLLIMYGKMTASNDYCCTCFSTTCPLGFKVIGLRL